MSAYLLEQLGVDRGPDRAERVLAALDGSTETPSSAAGCAIDSTGTSMRRSRSGACAASSTVTGAARAREEARDLPSGRWVALSPIRCGPAPPRRGDAGRDPLERQREVRPALDRGERMDLVDDHGLEAVEHRPPFEVSSR